MINTHEPDTCCGKALSKALLSGSLDNADRWTHEKCGLDWLAVQHYDETTGLPTIRHWLPHCPALRF